MRVVSTVIYLLPTGGKNVGISGQRHSSGVSSPEKCGRLWSAFRIVCSTHVAWRSGWHPQRNHLHSRRVDSRLPEQSRILWPSDGLFVTAANSLGRSPHVYGQRKAAGAAPSVRSLLFRVFPLQERFQSGTDHPGTFTHIGRRWIIIPPQEKVISSRHGNIKPLFSFSFSRVI